MQRESARYVLVGLLLCVGVLTGCPKARLDISVDLYREDPALSRTLTPGDMLEIHAHACPLYLVAVGLSGVAWAALTYFDAPPSAYV